MDVRDAAAEYCIEPVPDLGADDVPSGYQRTEVGVIPEDWDCVKLGTCVDLLTGFPFPSSGYAPAGTRLLRGSNVKRRVTDWSDDLTQFWPKVSPDIRRYLLAEGDVVVAMDGSLVGRSFATVGPFDLPALLLQRVSRLRGSGMAQSYVSASVCNDRFTKHCDSVKTTTAIPHISPLDIRAFVIALPPTKAEQEAIAEALSDADALIESLQQLIAKQRAIKQGAMQALLTGRQRLPGFSGEWPSKRLADIGTFRKGQGIPRSAANTGPLPAVRYGEIYTTHSDYVRSFATWISNAVAASATRIGRGDILFAGSGETKEEIGKCVAVVEDVIAYAGGDVVIFHPKDGEPLYFGYALNTRDVNEQKASRGQGDAVVHMSASALAQVTIAVPTVEEQTAIATVLSEMDAAIDALETRLAKTSALKAGMMQQLLTGRIRLPLDHAA